jgi:hypothetical protein
MTKALIRGFSEVQMANKYIKKCSTSLGIKELKMKIILRSYLIPVRVTTIKKTSNSNVYNPKWSGDRHEEDRIQSQLK